MLSVGEFSFCLLMLSSLRAGLKHLFFSYILVCIVPSTITMVPDATVYISIIPFCRAITRTTFCVSPVKYIFKYVNFCTSFILHMVIAASKYPIKALYSFKPQLNFCVSNFDNPKLVLISSVSRVSPGSYLEPSPVLELF